MVLRTGNLFPSAISFVSPAATCVRGFSWTTPDWPDGKRYLMIVKKDYSPYTRVFSSSRNFDTAESFKTFLADRSHEGIPYAVECIRSDNDGNFAGAAFAQLCRARGTLAEVMLADAPKLSGVAESGLHMTLEVAHAAYLEALWFFPSAMHRTS